MGFVWGGERGGWIVGFRKVVGRGPGGGEEVECLVMCYGLVLLGWLFLSLFFFFFFPRLVAALTRGFAITTTLAWYGIVE